jgi:hypothetical protein
MTPVIKAFFTDCGTQVSNDCLQVFGGHGYISEWGMEQLVRDARIAQIYEGANGIHALDLVGRKLPMHGGRLIGAYLDRVRAFVDECAGEAALEEFVASTPRSTPKRPGLPPTSTCVCSRSPRSGTCGPAQRASRLPAARVTTAASTGQSS